MPRRSLAWMWIAWPAFLAACLLQAVVFAFVDPFDIEWARDARVGSRQSVYAISFFIFWAIAMLSSGLTLLLGGQPSSRDQGAP